MSKIKTNFLIILFYIYKVFCDACEVTDISKHITPCQNNKRNSNLYKLLIKFIFTGIGNVTSQICNYRL